MRTPTSLSAFGRFDDDRNAAIGRPRLVFLVAGVELRRELPETLALGAFGLAGDVALGTAVGGRREPGWRGQGRGGPTSVRLTPGVPLTCRIVATTRSDSWARVKQATALDSRPPGGTIVTSELDPRGGPLDAIRTRRPRGDSHRADASRPQA